MPRMYFSGEDNNDITFDEPARNRLAVEPTLFARLQAMKNKTPGSFWILACLSFEAE